MQTPNPVPLVLGGHSFIHQLGSDPRPSEETATEIVAACLAQGITWFDTTYQPERIALGRILRQLNARNQATILAWNFFQDFDDAGQVGGPSCYQPHHLDLLCEQLQTNVIDILVVHALGDAHENRRQEELALEWRDTKLVRQLASWCPGADTTTDVALGVYDIAIAPGNIAGGGERFPAYKAQNWETLATSPFVRGWLLQRLAQESGQPVHEIADLMLRYAAFLPGVDRLVVSVRQPELVTQNSDSLWRGPLSPSESERLRDIYAAFGAG